MSSLFKAVALFFAVFAFGTATPAFAQSETAMAPAVIGSTWTAVEINGAVPVPRSTTTLIFSDPHSAGGKGGCNNWFADISLGDGTIRVGNITATGKGCGQAVIKQEQAFFAALRHARLWQLGDRELLLLDEAGIPLIRFAV